MKQGTAKLAEVYCFIHEALRPVDKARRQIAAVPPSNSRPAPVYLGITLDRSLTYRNHCMKTRAKLSSRNNLLRKLHGTNWGACPHTMRTTATALCLSVAEYCCPVWARSTHRKLVDTTLNETCRLITGCIRPTATPDLYVLSGIAPPEIRRSVHSQNERTKQLTDQRHSLHHHQPMKSRLHSRNSFVSSSQPPV